MDEKKSTVKIMVEYNDGSVVAVKKGILFHLAGETTENGQVEINADAMGMSSADLYTVIHAAVALGARLGILFRDRKAEEKE